MGFWGVAKVSAVRSEDVSMARLSVRESAIMMEMGQMMQTMSQKAG